MKAPDTRRIACMLLLVVAGLAGLRQSAHAQEYAGDITCGSKQRFTVPGECLNACSKQKRTLANLSGGLCFFSSSCPAYGKEPKSALPVFYNQALFGRGPVQGEQAKLVLASHIINTYFPPNNVKLIAVKIGATSGGDDFAHVEPAPRAGGKSTLTIQDDLFYTAPGYLISTIGHELIHVEQHKRTYKTSFAGINSLVGAMRELEASSWEIDADNFSRSFGANKAVDCMRDQEKAAQRMTFACRQWQVRKAIADIRESARRDTYFKSVEKWLNEDPWAQQVWLPDNPKWQTQAAGAQPKDCGNP
jgi:hypothetical protein